MKKVVIIGAGGQGRESADILRHQAQSGQAVRVLGFIDDAPALHGQLIDGLPVLGGWTWFDEADLVDVFVLCATGNPTYLHLFAERARERKLRFTNAVSPLAHLSPLARLGHGVTVYPNVVINTGADIGDHVIINLGTTVSHDASVGSFTNLNPGVRLAGNVRIGPSCYIGMGTSVIQGLTIGTGTIVGAGAAVVRDLPPNVTAVGVPARVIKHRTA